jgi:hypothetical protein
MKSHDYLRYSYIEMIRAHRSEILAEWERIESQRRFFRKKYIGEIKSSQNGPLMKIYLWFDLRFQMYRFEVREEQRLFCLRREHEQQLHRLKTTLHTVDF